MDDLETKFEEELQSKIEDIKTAHENTEAERDGLKAQLTMLVAEREDLEVPLARLEDPPMVSVCGAKNSFFLDLATVSYDYLFHSTTNLPGNLSLDIHTGVFTAPLSGLYLVS